MVNKKLIGVFKTETDAIKVIESLRANGYSDKEISVMAKHHDEVRNVENVTDTKIKTEDTARNTTTGAVTGGIIGAAGALLAEIGVLAIPGVGPFLAAGPIAATLGGIIAGGAVGGLAGALVDLGVDEAELDEFKGYLDQGYIIVAVDERDDYRRDLVYTHYRDNNSVIMDKYDYDNRVL